MLVMEYMDHGSLYHVLRNETMALDGEILLPILRDIAQGVRFLHAASPKVIHGDLKAQVSDRRDERLFCIVHQTTDPKLVLPLFFFSSPKSRMSLSIADSGPRSQTLVCRKNDKQLGLCTG
jgi:serine/threonine protein kinase